MKGSEDLDTRVDSYLEETRDFTVVDPAVARKARKRLVREVRPA